MLKRITISDYALFDHVELELGDGLNVLTGETGAGKSLVVDAIDAIVGERADLSTIRTGSDAATISAEFWAPPGCSAWRELAELGIEPEPDGAVLLTRRLSRASGSSCRINGQPATVSMLRQLGEKLVDLHGQHEHQSLLRVERHLDYLDDFGGPAVRGLRDQFGELYVKLRDLEGQRDSLRAGERELRQREDLLRFQVREIDSAELRPDEEEKLEADRQRLIHAEKLFQATATARRLLDDETGTGGDASGALRAALGELEPAASIDSQLKPVAEALQTALIHVDEAVRVLGAYGEGIEFEPQALDRIEARLRTIVNLKRKYGDSVAEVLEFRKRAASELEQIEHSEETIERLEREIAAVRSQMVEVGEKLSAGRRSAARKLRQQVEARLKSLGMEHARFEVAFSVEESPDGVPIRGTRVAANRRGLDKVEFLISTNPGEAPRPLARIASGGEISRIMLALRCVTAAAGQVPVLVFDEVDVGIGGTAAQAVGESLLELASTFQVVCVTHSPLIAALAHHQHRVTKRIVRNRTTIGVDTLDSEAQVQELARMLGDESAESALTHARELAVQGRRRREAQKQGSERERGKSRSHDH